MHCDACGNENRADSRFCDRCGAPLSTGCPACGASNRGDALFCSECGASVHPATPVADEQPAGPATERRQVSVLFADIVGFTTFAEGRDPERVRELQSRYFELATETVERHGGTVEKFIGDAVMAVWGTPTAHEDDAQRAVRTGLQLVAAVEGLGHELRARAGVVTGEAAVTIGAANQGMVAGDMVNTASRLQSSADGGEVLVDSSTVQAASTAIAFDQVDNRELKGKAAPVPVWRAMRVLAPRSGDNVVAAPFVGRAEELRWTKDLLNAAGRDRRIKLVSITGPAGIGKSRLVEELGIYADGLAEDVWWHTGRSPSYGEGLAFWALGEMVRRRAGLAEDDPPDVAQRRVAATVDEFVANADERTWIAESLLTLLGATDAPAEGESLFPAWRTFFERVAERGTTVLVFEDLQWADTGTLDFIEHLLDWSRSQPIVLVALARPELQEARPGWGTARSNASTMALEPLDGDAMRALLEGLVPGLPATQTDAIVQRAEGMPLYAVEIVRALVADGRLRRAGDVYEPAADLGTIAIPASLRSLIASRLDALDTDERSLLQHGSVLGQAFTIDALAAMTGRGSDDVEPRLRALVRREFLEIEADPRSPERGQYRFVQSLIREVAYETIAIRERRARHLAAARFLESNEADEVAGALASHYLAAYHASDEGPEADAVAAQARVSLRAAAERAATLGAHEQAVKNLEHALTITTDEAERAQLLERAAASAGVAVMPGASDFARQAVDAYRAIGDRQATLKATSTLAEVLLDAGEVPEADDILGKAIADLTDVDSASEGAAMVHAMSARAKMRLDDNDEAVAAADRAVEMGERLDLPLVIAAAIINKGSAYNGMGRRTEAVALLRAGVELAEAGGWPHLELRARGNLGTSVSGTSPGEALETYEGALEIARRIGDRSTFQFTAALRADMLIATGDPNGWAEANRLLDEAEALASPGVDRAYILNLRTIFASLRGTDVTDLLIRLDAEVSATTDPRGEILPHLSRAWSAWTASKWTDAMAEARLSWAIDSWAVFNHGGIVANTAIRTGDPGVVAELLNLTQDHPETSSWSNAVRRHLAAIAAALEGDRDRALGLFSESLDRWAQLGVRLDWGFVALNAILLFPDEPRVRAWAEDARERFLSLEAAPLVQMLDDALNGDAQASAPRAADVKETPAVSA